jgi:hypothetical protein
MDLHEGPPDERRRGAQVRGREEAAERGQRREEPERGRLMAILRSVNMPPKLISFRYHVRVVGVDESVLQHGASHLDNLWRAMVLEPPCDFDGSLGFEKRVGMLVFSIIKPLGVLRSLLTA